MKKLKTYNQLFENLSQINTIINTGSFDRIKKYIEKNPDFDDYNVMSTATDLNVYVDNKIDIIRYLIDYGVDLDSQTTHNGLSAIFYAYTRKYYEVINILIDAGADLNLLTLNNQSLLHYIRCEKNLEEINNKLLTKINWNIVDNYGETFIEKIHRHENWINHIIDKHPDLYKKYMKKLKAREFNL